VRDLEIRGAGNLLGGEQSGHINDIGFELYCQLLRSAVVRLKGGTAAVPPEVELNLDFVEFAIAAGRGRLAAALPPEYIGGERLRIDAYRRLSETADEPEIALFAESLADRFGPLPPPAAALVEARRITVLAAAAGFHTVSATTGKLRLEGAAGVHRARGGFPSIPAGTAGLDAMRWISGYLRGLPRVRPPA
jgi:transcription-repair coupling factor (superfamily II helicase)